MAYSQYGLLLSILPRAALRFALGYDEYGLRPKKDKKYRTYQTCASCSFRARLLVYRPNRKISASRCTPVFTSVGIISAAITLNEMPFPPKPRAK
jgi:hypothetical protein